MDYSLAIENTPTSIPGGTSILLLHPSTGETDQVDTDFLRTDTDFFLVISTRTTAREIQQKLEHYNIDDSNAVIIDTLSIERGYSRRRTNNVHYLSAPDDLDAIVTHAEEFFNATDGKRRISVDSITEMAYYADEDRTRTAIETLLMLLDDYNAIGLFHLTPEVHNPSIVNGYKTLFDAVIEINSDGTVDCRF